MRSWPSGRWSCCFPLYWVVVTSLKIEIEVDSGPFYIPFVDFQPTLDAWNFMLLHNNTLWPYCQFDRRRAGQHDAGAC